MRFFSRILLGLVLLGGLPGCIEEFQLPPSASGLHHLVVDGAVHIEAGTASIKLSRTQNLQNADKPAQVETKAVVVIEDQQAGRYQLSEELAGVYSAARLPLRYGQGYRVRIKTQDGKEYVSEFVTAQQTPPISQIDWHVERGGVQIAVSTTGADDGFRFYRYDFSETYHYESRLLSFFKFDQPGISRRKPNEFVYECWRTDNSKNILIASSQQLGQNVINKFPVTFRLGNGDHFSRKYSILVRQYAIAREEYLYWQMMQKNTENVGSLFDAQPSFVTGNVNCISDPSEVVFGYFSAQSIAEKRIFIDANEVREHNFGGPIITCDLVGALASEIPDIIIEKNLMIIDSLGVTPPPKQEIIYSLSTRQCVDCTVKGGSPVKPAFWP